MTKVDVEIFNAIRFAKPFDDGETSAKCSAKGVKIFFDGECIFKRNQLKNKWTVTVGAQKAAPLISRLNTCLFAVEAPVMISHHGAAYVVKAEDGAEYTIPGSAFNQHYVEKLLEGTLAAYLH